jgi:hypothetical protein
MGISTFSQQTVNTGLATPVSSGNLIINGAFDIWQRGTSFTAAASYTADRFRVDLGAVTRQAGTAGIPYCLRIANALANPAIRQAVELPAVGDPGQFISGSTWTVSFYARTSTSIASNLAIFVAFSTAVYDSGVTVSSVTNIGASSTTWTRYSHTFTVNVTPGATNNGLTIVPYLNSGAYAGNFEITGVQLEAGAVATPFRRNAPSIAAELAACMRYYQRFSGGVGCGLSGMGANSTQMILNYSLPVTMRANNVPGVSGQIAFSDQFATDPTAANATRDNLQGNTQNGGRMVMGGFSGLTTGRYYSTPGTIAGSGFVDFSAEL